MTLSVVSASNRIVVPPRRIVVPALHEHYTKAMSYKGLDNAFVAAAAACYIDYKDEQHTDYKQPRLGTLAILDYSSYLPAGKQTN